MPKTPTYREGEILFCQSCGERNIMRSELHCSKCGFDLSHLSAGTVEGRFEEISDKSFGIAAVLCGISGILGIHHFYLGNVLHGLFDLGLFIVGMALLFSINPFYTMVGVFLILLDVLHSVAVMIQLFTGRARDSEGKLVAYPGQF